MYIEENQDASLGENLADLFSGLNQSSNHSSLGSSFESLTDEEIDNLFRNDKLIKKIICKYPNSAKSLGYELKDLSGEIIDSNDSLVLKAFDEASIMARKYGKAYLVFSDGNSQNLQLTKSSKLESYKVLFNLKTEGNFYIFNEEKIHKSKVYIFLGERTYLKNTDIDKDNYSDSILQSIKRAFDCFFNSHEVGYYILCNLSYLIMGIQDLKNQSMTEEGRSKVRDRLNSVNVNRDITRIITHDAIGEKVSFISQSMSGATDMIDTITNLLLTYSDYPQDQLLEHTPKQNMGSGIANQLIARMLWAKRLKTWVEENWLDNYKKLFSILKGENIKVHIPFKVEMNIAEQAEVEDKAASRLEKLIRNKIISINEARTSYKSSEFTLNIVLDENFNQEPQSAISTPESEQNEPNTDSTINDQFWDNLANLSESDLIEVAESVLS